MRIYILGLLLIAGGMIFSKGAEAMKITSPEFTNGGNIPAKFTCQGKDVSPQLDIADVPVRAKSFALIVDDPDAPRGNWDHWIVYNIPATMTTIQEGSVPGVQCINDSGSGDWGGPCPPSGTHRYFFKIFALDAMLVKLPETARKADLVAAMQGHILDKAELVGLYKKAR